LKLTWVRVAGLFQARLWARSLLAVSPLKRYRHEHRGMKTRIILLLCIACASSAPAQTPDTVVEVLGLKKWTFQMVQDSVAHYAPGTTLGSWACAVILRDSIGFAQASVQEVQFPDHVYRTLAVVEPDERKTLRPLTLRDSAALRPEWRGLIAALAASPNSFGFLQDRAFFTGASNTALGRPADSATLRVRNEVLRAATMTEIDDAVRGFTRDKGQDTRVASALVLGQKADDPRAWLALMKGLRGPSDYATSAGQMVLSGMIRSNPPAINWKPAENDIAGLLAGTNLFAYLDVLNVLSATRIDPALGRKLARKHKSLLVDNVNSKSPMRRSSTMRFVNHISGMNFSDPASATVWLHKL
jgi:hypothetical protein